LRRLLLLVVVLVAGCGGKAKDVTYAKVDTTAVAPPFSLALLSGKTLDSASLWQRRPVVVLFFASWCSKCARQQDGLKQVMDDYGDAVGFVGIAGQDTPEAVGSWVKEHDVGYPVGIDRDLATWRRYAVRTPPAVVLVAPGGKLFRGWPGGVDADTLDEALTQLVIRGD
jgi:thiol-disulfide isomerase/thioredoxin